MRPVPRSRHLAAVLVFAAVAAASGYMAFMDRHLSDTQIEIATGALKRQQPELFKHDLVFGEGELWRVHSPAMYGLLELSLVPTEYRDLALPFRLLAPVAVMIYLCAMYPLLYRQCRSWSISTLVAVLSSTVTFALGGSYWGVGSLGSITPRALCLPVVPLVVLAYLRYADQPRLPLVFAFVGLLGNIHLVTSLNLTLALLITYLGTGRFARSRWPMAIACGLSAAAAASPYALYYLLLRTGAVPPGASVSPDVVAQALRNLAVLYPSMLNALLYWLLLVGVLAVPAAAVLFRVERFRVRDLGVWVWFIAGGLGTALVLHGLSQVAGLLFRTAPPVIDLVQASSLVMLPLYVLLAQALTNLFRIIRGWYPHLLRWGCAALLAAWMIPADNFRVARHSFYELAAGLMPSNLNVNRRVQELRLRRERREALTAIANWAKAGKNTATDAVFIIDAGEFRMLASRAIFVTEEDVRYAYYLAPWRMEECSARLKEQARQLRQPDVDALAQFVRTAAAKDLADVPEWYIVLQAGLVPDKMQGLELLAPQGWDKHYQVYRIYLTRTSSGSRPATGEAPRGGGNVPS